MSIAACEKCGRFIDTDENPEAYEVTDEDCNEIALEYPLCDGCKDDYIALVALEKKVSEFTTQIFDWVTTLKQTEFLGRCYEFQSAIQEFLNPKKGRRNG